MPEKIKMEYPLMEQMAKTFGEGQKQLQDTSKAMGDIAKAMEGGVLLGEGGSAFTEAIESKLCPAINKLAQKFQELQGDINVAMQDMKAADKDSKGMFA